jgi:hypothetical protein
MEIKDNFLSVDNCGDGDIITILDTGVSDVNKWGKTRYNFQVTNGSYSMIFTPNFLALKEMMKAWGRNTDTWKDKKFQVKIVPNPASKAGKAIYPVPMTI